LAAPPGDPSWPENLTFPVVNWAHRPGTSSSQKIAPAGHAGSQAPQPAHSPGGCSIRLPSQVQSAGHSPAQVWSLTPVHGSVITYVMGGCPS